MEKLNDRVANVVGGTAFAAFLLALSAAGVAHFAPIDGILGWIYKISQICLFVAATVATIRIKPDADTSSTTTTVPVADDDEETPQAEKSEADLEEVEILGEKPSTAQEPQTEAEEPNIPMESGIIYCDNETPQDEPTEADLQELYDLGIPEDW